ncbi:flagellar M-ring protein FliF [Desulfurobacterium pacificum]|uniref:Flagellar M-ring protein n=1 Tax=Desulfurobacterium pacificum TaxID=240166 RepID=A0ABY1NN16_9BACT|nr:flagellar basal-body MS-ring/collar protein FliF [Desulfurobacterium pacificum]SMP13801.1 flagellar M-ring protein FliF [Desulfurobacterium pacificum]
MNLEEIKTKVEKFLREKATPKNIVIIISLLAILSFSTIVLVKKGEGDYAVLYTHLNPDDAGAILSVLQQEKIPYKVVGDGSIILVPKDKVYEVRLKLAAKGLPHGKVVGFEIFDEPKLGITQFQEHVEYLRALEGELERTIKQIDAVKNVRVNIALPKDSIFVREEQEPKASVLVQLWDGMDLTPEQVKAIVFLVSHAVPGLKPENVTVVDNRGRVLSDILQEEKDNLGTSKELEIKQKLEREIQRKVQSMLSQVLGGGRVVVRASVEVETGKVETQKEIYDPDKTAVVSQRKIQEKETGIEKKQQGVPGTSTNVPPVVNLNGGNQVTTKEKKDVTTNYDVSKTIEKSVTPVFKIKRITVAVLVDGKYQKEKDKNGNEIIKFVPRSPEEIKTYEDIVKSAIGYDPKRGDRVTVASVPFEARELFKSTETGKQIPWYYYLIAALGVMGLASVVLIKVLKGKKAPLEESEGGMGVPEAVLAEMKARAEHRAELEEIKIEQDPIYLKIVEIARDYPELISNIVSKWIKEEGLTK